MSATVFSLASVRGRNALALVGAVILNVTVTDGVAVGQMLETVKYLGARTTDILRPGSRTWPNFATGPQFS